MMMKKIILSILMVLVLILSIQVASATTFNSNSPMGFTQIRNDEKVSSSQQIVSTMKIKNRADFTLHNLKFSAQIAETNVRVSRGLEKLASGNRYSKTLILDTYGEDIEPGEYMVKYVISDENGHKRVKYRPIDII